MESIRSNTQALRDDFNWFSEIIQLRFKNYFQPESAATSIYEIPPPDLPEDSTYTNLLEAVAKETDAVEPWEQIAQRLLLLLALAPHLQPAILDVFYTRNTLYDRGFTEFGGVNSKQHGGFLPTGETAMFLLTGGNLELRIRLLSLFDEDHPFFTKSILDLRGRQSGEPFLSGILTLTDDALARLTTGAAFEPRYSTDFPARRLTTKMEWSDLILDPHLLEDLSDISTWLNHESTIMEELGMNKHLKPGFRVLFHGPPGTGKTLCATLLGKQSGRPVYRVDLSQVVSKYIGETEKNLARLFAQAEHQDWILFFDEADALFGKRTTTRGSNDRYANQEVAYLLQRIEGYDGLVILASNLKTNIDEAFARRFQSMLYFPLPGSAQRLKLWQNILEQHLPLAKDIDLQAIASRYELAGGSIVNVARYCALAAVKRSPHLVTSTDIREGVRRELRKGGKTG